MAETGTYDYQIESERNIRIVNFGGDQRTEVSLDETTVCWARGHRGGGVLLRSTSVSEDSTRKSSIFCGSSFNDCIIHR